MDPSQKMTIILIMGSLVFLGFAGLFNWGSYIGQGFETPWALSGWALFSKLVSLAIIIIPSWVGWNVLTKM